MKLSNDDRQNASESEGASEYPRKLSRGPNSIKVKGTLPYEREKVMKWYAWGYNDSFFYLKDGVVRFSGNRYPICNVKLPFLREYMDKLIGVELTGDLEQEIPSLPEESEYPSSRLPAEDARALRKLGVRISTKGSDRLVRSHGQGLCEIDKIMRREFERIPDAVAWPTCHEEVVELVRVCVERGVVVFPYGGGTSVSGAATCPAHEERPILSLDTTAMNEILRFDEANSTALCEAGIIGQDLERELRKIGYTCGHEPDSIEFSTLGGWVATRASGMKKNAYGNIEDIVVHARMVTPRGVLEKGCRAPRVSCGPDFDHVILGSEGCFGIVTEVTIKIRPLPARREYGSIVFPDMETGIECFREIARRRCVPASLRLMDNEQYQLGRALRPAPSSSEAAVDALKLFYLTKVKGFDLKKIAVATILYEGDESETAALRKKIESIAIEHGGIPAGRTNGKRGYGLTFVIGYVRDIAYQLMNMTESVETSVPWDRVARVIEKTKAKISSECVRLNIAMFVVMARVAQVYESGACVYFYFGINAVTCREPAKTLIHLEEIAKDSIVANGGSLSHHHGVGKSRRRWYEGAVSPVGLNLFRACKTELDPQNLFATVNITENLRADDLKL